MCIRRELKYVLEDSQASLVMSTADFSGQIGPLAESLGLEHHILGNQVSPCDEDIRKCLVCHLSHYKISWPSLLLGQTLNPPIPWIFFTSVKHSQGLHQKRCASCLTTTPQCSQKSAPMQALQGVNLEEDEVASRLQAANSAADEADGSLIIYTSGTTGRPKGTSWGPPQKGF